MSFIETVQQEMFAERFGGSLYTRFNQEQLEGNIDFFTNVIYVYLAITSFNEWISDELMKMLKLEHEIPKEYEPVDPSHEPCWVDSIQDSKAHFDSLVEFLNDRYNFLAQEILKLGSSPNVTHRIRRSG